MNNAIQLLSVFLTVFVCFKLLIISLYCFLISELLVIFLSLYTSSISVPLFLSFSKYVYSLLFINLSVCFRLFVSFLGEMQRIAFRLMLSSCVSVCVCLSVCVYMPRLWTSGKWFEIETPFFF